MHVLIAEMTRKAHDQLMRIIRGYIKVLDDSAILQTPNLFLAMYCFNYCYNKTCDGNNI